MAYTAPVEDLAFALESVADLSRLEGSAGLEAYAADLISPIVEEAGKLAHDVLAPLNSGG